MYQCVYIKFIFVGADFCARGPLSCNILEFASERVSAPCTL